MSKTLLVAQREYLENLRTKTFWIGILLFPVIIGVFALVSRVLARSKDQRPYAVLDYTQGAWLSQEIERRGISRDLDTFLQERTKAGPEKPKSPAELRAAWQKAKEQLGNDRLGAVLDVFIAMPDDDVAELLAAADSGKPPLGVMLKHLPALQSAIGQFDGKEMGKLFAGLALTKYRRIPTDGLGSDPAKVEEKLRDMVKSGELFAYVVMTEEKEKLEPGTGLPVITGRYVSNNLTDSDLRRWYTGLATEIMRERRVSKLMLSKEQAQALQDDFRLRARSVSSAGAEEDVSAEQVAGNWAPMGFVYLLWIAVFSISQMLLTNTVEEKSNRIIEVLLSSVSPHQLMTGKIFGIAATGLTMIGSWVIFALLGLKVIDLDIRWASVVNNPLYLASFVGYFLAGYLIYAAVLVAIGSVCNSLKEAQNLMQPVILVLMVPIIAMVFVVQDPNGSVSRILTYIPLYTPFLMMNRAGGPPPAWEYVASTILIVLTIAVAFWAAGRVFRVGILMTGKPPKTREILAWLFHPPGDAANARS